MCCTCTVAKEVAAARSQDYSKVSMDHLLSPKRWGNNTCLVQSLKIIKKNMGSSRKVVLNFKKTVVYVWVWVFMEQLKHIYWRKRSEYRRNKRQMIQQKEINWRTLKQNTWPIHSGTKCYFCKCQYCYVGIYIMYTRHIIMEWEDFVILFTITFYLYSCLSTTVISLSPIQSLKPWNPTNVLFFTYVNV